MLRSPTSNDVGLDYRAEYKHVISSLNQRPGTKFNGYYLSAKKITAFALLLRQMCEKMSERESFRCQVIVDINKHFCGLDFSVRKNTLRIFLLDAAGDRGGHHMADKFKRLFKNDDMAKFFCYVPEAREQGIQTDATNCFWITLKCLLELSKLDDYFDKPTQQTSRALSDLPPQLAVILKPIQRVNIAEWKSIKAYGDRTNAAFSSSSVKTSSAGRYASAAPSQSWSHQGQTVIQVFEVVAQKVPRNIAVSYDGCELTYEALNARANQLARFIQQKHSQCSRANIGICLESKLDTVIAILAVLKLGGAYVPLDPIYPPERLAFIAKDSALNFVIGASKTTGMVRCGSLNLDENRDQIDSQSAENLSICSKPQDICYILYTSGSTGRPKGVVVTHQSLLFNIANYTRDLAITFKDNLLQLASFSHDQAVVDMYGALLNGAQLCLVDLKKESRSLARIIQQQYITIYSSIPNLFRTLFSHSSQTELQSLRVITIGGDTVTYEDVALYRKIASPDCVLVNGYGATEISWALQYRIDHSTPIDKTRPIPIGFPVEGVEVVLLDENINRIEKNCEVGEIALCSDYLANGYWDLPEQTSKAFISLNDGRRVYLTGDMAARLPSGAYEFCGRKAWHVKILGQRINLGEVEAVIKQQLGVAACAVISYETNTGTALAAFVVMQSAEAKDGKDIQANLQQILPNYIVPSSFFYVSKIPELPNGKIDRSTLKQNVQQDYNDKRASMQTLGPVPAVGPGSPGLREHSQTDMIEPVIVKLVQDVLGRRMDHRFKLYIYGDMDSLQTMAFLSRVNAQFNMALTYKNLKECPTVSQLASCIRAHQGNSMKRPEGYSDALYQLISAPVKPKTGASLVEYLQAHSTDNFNNTIEQRKTKWTTAAAKAKQQMPNNFPALFALSMKDEFANLLYCLVFPEPTLKTSNKINVDSTNLKLIRVGFIGDFLILLAGSFLTTCTSNFISELFKQHQDNFDITCWFHFYLASNVCWEAISKRNLEFLEYFCRYKSKDIKKVLQRIILHFVLCDNAAGIAWLLYSWWPFVKTLAVTYNDYDSDYTDKTKHKLPRGEVYRSRKLSDVIESNSKSIPNVYQAFKIWKYSSLRAFCVIKSTYYFATFVGVGKIKISCRCLGSDFGVSTMPGGGENEQDIDISVLTKKFPFQRKLLAFSSDARILAVLQEEGTLVWLYKQTNGFGVRHVSEVDLSGEPTCIACAFDDPLNICGIVAIGYGHGNKIDIYQVRNSSLNKQAEISIKNPTCLTFIGSKNPYLAVGNLNGDVVIYQHNNWLSPVFNRNFHSGVIESICFDEESRLLQFVAQPKLFALDIKTYTSQSTTLPASNNPMILSGSMVFYLNDEWRDVATVKSAAEFNLHNSSSCCLM